MNEMTAAQELEKAREVTNCPLGVDLQDHLKQLVEEILLLNNERLAWAELYGDEVGDPDVMEKAKKLPIPATDSILREAEARGVAPLVNALKVIANSEQHNGDTIVCDFDTLISVAASALRDYYAKQLREGKAE